MNTLEQFTVNAEEYPEPIPVAVKGTIPAWLKGSMIRVGPGLFQYGDFSFNHWQDGMAVMSKFSISPGGKVTFRQRYLQSDALRKLRSCKRPVYTEFGTPSYPDPSKNFFSRMINNFDPSNVTDNASSNIITLGNDVFLTSETSYLRRIDPSTLETREKIDLHKLTGANFITSHPITDHDGFTYNVGTSFTTAGCKYIIMRIPPSDGGDPFSNARVLTTISSSWKASSSYQHSFSLTENYILVLEQPFLVSMLKLATCNAKGRSLDECVDWYPQEMTKFIVVNKHTGEVVSTRYLTEKTIFVLHHVNAYEVKDQIVVDLIAYPSPDIISNLYLDNMRNGTFEKNGHHPQLTRYVLPIIDDIHSVSSNEELAEVAGFGGSAMRVIDSRLGDHISLEGQEIGEPGIDMPKINPEHLSKEYRYMWGCGGFEQAFFKGAVGKIDVVTGECRSWRATPDTVCTEPVFVPRPGADAEDDGVLVVTSVSFNPEERDAFVVLDAKTLTELARAEIDQQLGGSLHATFLPNRY